MEAQRLSKAQRLDAITILPEAIVETILCLLPIEEAARTSILSRAWRYKWTKIPKLVFLESTVKGPTKEIDLKQTSDSEIAWRNKDMRCKLFNAIRQVLLLRQGPIHEVDISMTEHHTFFELDQIILHLSRNHTVKKVTLDFFNSKSNGLPLSVFSLPHLTDLYVEYCAIDHKPIFNWFGSLTSLSLDQVTTSREILLHLLSNCSSLKSCLCLPILEERYLDLEKPDIVELFKCLPPVIEQLTTSDSVVLCFVLEPVPQELPISLIHLKYFCFEDIPFADGNSLTFLPLLFKCSPNLEKLKLEINTVTDCFDVESFKLEEYSFKFEKHSDIRLENLKELEINNFRNFEPEFEFVKFILARSPNLKKVKLLHYIDNKIEELEMKKSLLRSSRASRVEIIVENHCKDLDVAN